MFSVNSPGRGRRIEDVLWKAWGGPPTTRWLRPWDQTCSDQQKSKWRGAIKQLTGLSLPASVPQGGSQDDVDRLIADGTRQLRYALRGKPEAAILAIHNEDYGFARNLCGVRWWWVALSLLCLIGCGVAFAFGLRPYLGLGVAGAFTVASIFVGRELPDYVKLAVPTGTPNRSSPLRFWSAKRWMNRRNQRPRQLQTNILKPVSL